QYTDLDVTYSNYSSELTTNSHIYFRRYNSRRCFYEAIQINVNTTGSYTLTSNSPVDTIGYLYRNDFDPSNISINLLLANDDGGGNGQFEIQYSLEQNTTYILVVTTSDCPMTGQFLITASGPDQVSFERKNIMPTVTTTMITTIIGE
ncbi:unnamed protein product, partial [Rotaria sordida]